ncbi:MAG: MarR family transcriptional regulator [Acidimicrobiia bacterium]|nr:MarR family transcriptional regulator [Acidimicrobiia bacterium]
MTPGDRLREAALGRLAAQWTALGAQLEGGAETRVVDLEALLVATARLAPDEPRVAEVALAWSTRHGSAVNGARLRTVAAELDVVGPTAEFAGAVRRAGGQPWPVAATGEPGIPWRGIDPRPGLVVVRDLTAPARLVWRLRAGFGVNARADILAVLLGAPTPLSIADLAARTRFGKRAVAGAVADMSLAGLADVERAGNADRVRLADGAPVRAWLGAPAVPARDEASRWRCVLAALDLHDRIDGAPDAVRAVEGRAASDTLRPALAAGGLPRPDATMLGVAFAFAVDTWFEAMAAAVAP